MAPHLHSARALALSILAALLVLCFAVTASAEAPVWNVGAKAGVLFPGEVYIEALDESFDTEQGFVGELTVDYAVAPNFMVGLFALAATITPEDIDEDADVRTLGFTLKTRFGSLGKFEVRPGFGMGYQTISGGSQDDVTGMDLAAILEVNMFVNKNVSVLGEVSFISQPVGGNDDTELTFAPIIFVAGGLAYNGF